MRPGPAAACLVPLFVAATIACPPRAPGAKGPAATAPAPTRPLPEPPPEITPQSAAGDRGAIQREIGRARTIIAALKDRALTAEQRDQVDSGTAFIDQAEQALRDGDLDQAAVLARKGLALLEQVDKDTKPAAAADAASQRR
jgi:hypothetical protein